MSVTVLSPPASIGLDPSDVRTIAFDWDRKSLRAGVTISTSTWTITAIKQSGVTALTKDTPSILSAADATTVCERTVAISRVTQVRLIATTATEGDDYEVTNTIVTSETPTQTKTLSCVVRVRNQGI